jgi:sec-independent protein translocase protein TatC
MLFDIFKKFFSKLIDIRKKHEATRDENGDVVKPFLDHMEDLRWMIVKCAVVLGICMVAAFYFRQDLMHLLEGPVHAASARVGEEIKLRSDNVVDSFMISLKLAFYVGLIFSLPFILYFIAEFVLPALTKREKRLLFPGFALGLVFFLGGAAASYLYIMPEMLVFFYKDAKGLGIDAFWTWKNYISVFTWLIIGFGLMCELPLIVLLLASVGIINFELLASTRRYAFIGILVLTAIVAPTPDPMTFITLAAPVLLMYEGCIWIVWLLESRRRKRQKESVVDELIS